MLPLALLPLLNNIHWTLVLRLRFDGKKLPSIFFRLYLHCLLSVIDVLCIIHYAVIVHIAKLEKNCANFAENCLAFLFSSIFHSMLIEKCTFNEKLFRAKPGDVFLYCLYSFCFRFQFFSSGFSANHPICTPMLSSQHMNSKCYYYIEHVQKKQISTH